MEENEIEKLIVGIVKSYNGKPVAEDLLKQLINMAGQALTEAVCWEGVIKGTIFVRLIDGELMFTDSPDKFRD